MNAQNRAGDSGANRQAFGHFGNPADHTPDKRAMALPLDPWMKVVRDQSEGETGGLSALGVPNQILGRGFLACERISNFDAHARISEFGICFFSAYSSRL